MARKLGIIAYGSLEDRLKLELLARNRGCSGSEWIITKIRKEYELLFGDMNPSLLVTGRVEGHDHD